MPPRIAAAVARRDAAELLVQTLVLGEQLVEDRARRVRVELQVAAEERPVVVGATIAVDVTVDHGREGCARLGAPDAVHLDAPWRVHQEVAHDDVAPLEA